MACNTWLVDRCYCHIGNHGDVLLISFDGSEARDMALDAVVTGKEHSEYFGKIEMLYCKRQQGHYGTEKLKTEKIDKVILSKEQWENETGKIKLLELWNCIQFEIRLPQSHWL